MNSFLDQTFVDVFQNYKLRKNITSFSTIQFQQATAFSFVCKLNRYLVLDYNNSKIISYDQNFTYRHASSSINKPQFITTVKNSNSFELFISSGTNGVFKLNSSLSVNYSFFRWITAYGGIYYNHTGDYILACSTSNNMIEILRRDDLTFIKYISTSPFPPTDIREYNGTLYVSTSNSNILAIQNEKISFNFTTICNSITSLSIDKLGNIAVVCSPYIYLYSTNGSYLNLSWISPIENITSIGFDGFGNFILIAYSGVYSFN